MHHHRHAMTLLELVVVLAVLIATSSLLVPLFSGTLQSAQEDSTRRTLLIARAALLDYWSDTRLIAMDGIVTAATENDRLDLIWLFRNPVSNDDSLDYAPATGIGWRGPYIASSTGDLVTVGYPHLIDAWNREIAVQDVNPATTPRDIRIVSAGANGTIEIPSATATDALTPIDLGDDIYVALRLH